ncbi:uncharacterized protein [Onthophagus taurus]|uniref:uncharacterized protein n=1 Tax=Onthophagus taurus TaxID=166361 RepID=UPI000C1FEF7C|nr:uncharacterized protein LOC111420866 [Onthophagus taurus]
MYRACLVNPEQTRLQMILWRDSDQGPIDTYELLTVTYGTASASYLATRCLKELSNECKNSVIAEVIGTHFYVDDLLTGANSIDELNSIVNQVKSKLSEGGFELAKWTTNSSQVIREFTQSVELVDLGRYENTRTLRLLWDPGDDQFRYKITEMSYQKITKRSILSDIAQVFDPIGFLSPVIISAKVIFKRNLAIRDKLGRSITK